MAKRTTTKKPTSEKKKRVAKKSAPKKRKTTKARKKKQSSKLKNFILALILSFIVIVGSYISYCIITLPDIDKAIMQTRQPMTTVIAQNGNEVATIGNIYSDAVMLYDVSPNLINAIISTEDRRFYSHLGFDGISFIRAMVANLKHGRYAQGGSTITQQVAKNLFLTQNKTIKRKVQELLLAFWLESKFSKDQILTLYLNRVYLGSGTYGVQSASHRYFNKSVSELNIREASILAGMLKGPSKYNPLTHKQKSLERSKVVLQNMVDNNIIDKKQMNLALNSPIGSGENNRVKDAKHFADWVYLETNNLLGEREVDVLVHTTLNQKLQEKAQKILDETIKSNKDKKVTQGAIVVLDKSGAVKALVGGVNYNKSQFNRATQALRQPGSTFKTFVYLAALQNGFKTEDEINDFPITIGKWKPDNIGGKSHGTVTLNEAFINSYNLAAVDLSQKVGLGKIIKTAQDLGISTAIKKSPAIVLGSAEVKVIDMAAAYATIANGGDLITPYVIISVYAKSGNEIYNKPDSVNKKVAKYHAIEKLTKMMENVVNNGTGKKAKSNSFAAGKTGTSQGYRDAWFIGFTKTHTVAVWLGNDDNSPMKNVGGSGLPTEIWKKVVDNIDK